MVHGRSEVFSLSEVVAQPAVRKILAQIGSLELLDIPGRWGRMDAFGRGRVDVEKRPRARAQLGVVDPAAAGKQRGR